jgi:hypothetical protein
MAAKGEDVMPSTESFFAEQLTKFFEAAWLDFPAAAGKILLGAGDDAELRKAGWKAYDAWVSLANEVTNAVYSNPVIGEVTGRVMESALRLRQIGGAIAAASFSNLWPSIGLPTHSEMVAVRDELLALREELAAYAASMPGADDSAGTHEHDTLRAIGKSAEPGVYRGANGNGSGANGNSRAIGRLALQGKRHAAA